METVAYNVIQPPFTLKFTEMSKKELREYNKWFHAVMPERIDELANTVKSSPGFETWKPDYKVDSLNTLGKWFATQVQTRPHTREEIETIAARSPYAIEIEPWELTNRTFSLAIDMAMYLGQVMLRTHPSLKWDQLFGSKKMITYGRPVLVGFTGDVPMNPVEITLTLAYGLARKHKKGDDLRKHYEYWSKILK